MSTGNAGEVKRIWTPVKRQAADSYLILMIAAFAVTVIVVRVFLQVSGFPRIGGQTFHIAHLLWGGLLLFGAQVLVLMWQNSWTYWVAAGAGGAGVGLFIDEVGKFITTSNDYFIPLAFPIIYAFLLACVWLYVRVRRSRPRDTRTLLYHALGDLQQVLDHDLDPFERKQLVNELTEVMARAENTDERRLGNALLDYVNAQGLMLARGQNRLEQGWNWVVFIASRWPSNRTFRLLLIVGFLVAGLSAMLQMVVLYAEAAGWMRDVSIANQVIVSGPQEYSVDFPALVFIHAMGNLVTGLQVALAAVLLAVGRERRGLRIGTLGLLLSLTVVNLLTFYFSQLYAVAVAASQLTLLLGASIYRWRFWLNR